MREMIVQNILTAHRQYEDACNCRKKDKELTMLLNAFNRWYKMATYEEQGEFHHIFCNNNDQSFLEIGLDI